MGRRFHAAKASVEFDGRINCSDSVERGGHARILFGRGPESKASLARPGSPREGSARGLRCWKHGRVGAAAQQRRGLAAASLAHVPGLWPRDWFEGMGTAGVLPGRQCRVGPWGRPGPTAIGPSRRLPAPRWVPVSPGHEASWNIVLGGKRPFTSEALPVLGPGRVRALPRRGVACAGLPSQALLASNPWGAEDDRCVWGHGSGCIPCMRELHSSPGAADGSGNLC